MQKLLFFSISLFSLLIHLERLAIAQTQTLIPLEEYFEVNDLKDPAVLEYASLRCSALFTYFSVIVIRGADDPEAVRPAVEQAASSSGFFMKFVELSRLNYLKSRGAEINRNEVLNKILADVKVVLALYDEAGEKLYLSTGHILVGTWIDNDMNYCKQFLAAFGK